MITHWEQFYAGSDRKRVLLPRVSINRRAEFSFNREALRLLDEPESVALFFDRMNSRIGVRRCEPDSQGAFRLADKDRSRRGGKVLYARNFVNYYKISLDRTLIFNGVERTRDGYLVLDLARAIEYNYRETPNPRAHLDNPDGAEISCGRS